MKISRLKKLFDLGFLKFLLHDSVLRARRNYGIYKLMKENPTLCIEEDVQIKSPHLLTLGENILVQKGTILHCGGMKWCNYGGFIRIGSDSAISPYCVFYGGGGIDIGERFECGPGVKIFSSRTCYNSKLTGQKNRERLFNKVTISNDVVIFSGAVINLGVNIGNGAVIGAQSLVMSDIPPNEVWAGVPARFIKKREVDTL